MATSKKASKKVATTNIKSKKPSNVASSKQKKKPQFKSLKRTLIPINNEFGATGVANPDKILKTLQANGVSVQELYEDMLSDDHIASVVEVLVSGILRHPWNITGKDKAKTDFIKKVFSGEQLKVRELIYSLVLGHLIGRKTYEVKWENQDGWWVPLKMTVIPNTSLEVTSDKGLFHPDTGIYLDEHPRKFLTSINKEIENPHGVAEILKCYYPWQFKKAGWRFWLITSEKYGVPTLVVEYDSENVDDDDEKTDELATDFYNIENDSVIITNNLKDVHVIESRGSSEDFKVLIDQAEQAISKIIVGTHVIMDGQSGGSRALAEIHANINFRFKVQTAIYSIVNTLNRLCQWAIDLNFMENDGDTNFAINYVNIQEWEKIREAIDRDIEVSLEAVYMHVPQPKNKKDIFIKPAVGPLVIQDEKNPTKETKSDTDDGRKKKDDKKKEETRTETSQPGKEQTGENQ